MLSLLPLLAAAGRNKNKEIKQWCKTGGAKSRVKTEGLALTTLFTRQSTDCLLVSCLTGSIFHSTENCEAL